MKARCGWPASVIPTIEKQKQQDHDFEASWALLGDGSAASVLKIVLVLNIYQ